MSADRNGSGTIGTIGSMRHVHVVGVAGSGLSGMARLLQCLGMEVSGSESRDSRVLQKLRSSGVRCSVGHAEENVRDGTDLLLISAAIGQDNPEVTCARRRGIPVLKYAQLLGRLMSERKGIAIAGTHGKTTTTAMVGSILTYAGRDPCLILGGEFPAIGGGSRAGRGEFFVAEACEYDRSFLNFNPAYAIVTNIEEDHMDYFETLAEIQEAFGEFASHLPPGGYLVINGDDPRSAHLPSCTRAAVGRFSLQAGHGDWWAEDLRPAAGGIRFLARSAVGDAARLSLRVPGIHNVKNALAAMALLRRVGLSLGEIVPPLEAFGGVRRRFEVLRRDPVVVIDDYGHHPTEIEAVLRAARETYPGRRIRLVFQPHQYSRTRHFLGRFAEVLARADEAIVAEVYRARDSNEEVKRVNAAALVAEVRARGGNALPGASFQEILEHLGATSVPGDVIICLGAGDITVLTRRIAEELWPPEDVREPVVSGAARPGGGVA